MFLAPSESRLEDHVVRVVHDVCVLVVDVPLLARLGLEGQTKKRENKNGDVGTIDLTTQRQPVIM